MQWSKPDYQEISLGMEVTAYVNTDDDGNNLGKVAHLASQNQEPGGQPNPRQADTQA